jgi:hypothetical protein
MYKALLFFTFTFISITKTCMGQSQMMTAEQVVQKNLDAYNRRDIEDFMSWFTPDIKFHNFSDNTITIDGTDQCRKVYQELFDRSPKLHSTILKRIVFDNKVIDHESITGRLGAEKAVELVLIYEVRDDKIFRVTVIRK